VPYLPPRVASSVQRLLVPANVLPWLSPFQRLPFASLGQLHTLRPSRVAPYTHRVTLTAVFVKSERFRTSTVRRIPGHAVRRCIYSTLTEQADPDRPLGRAVLHQSRHLVI
jgi:hypothetical protein